jgi:hypothetical protein
MKEINALRISVAKAAYLSSLSRFCGPVQLFTAKYI